MADFEAALGAVLEAGWEATAAHVSDGVTGGVSGEAGFAEEAAFDVGAAFGVGAGGRTGGLGFFA